jgi:hypothetical protein
MAGARRYLPAALAGALLGLAAYDLTYWMEALRSAPLAHDSTIYYVAAQIGLVHGWNRIYDVGLQAQVFTGLHAGMWDPNYFVFSNPPPLAWLFAPLTLVPPLAAYLILTALSLIALVGAAVLTGAAAGSTRVLFVLGAIAWYPVVYGLRLGQVSLLVGALVVLSWWFQRRGRPELAGVVLALAVIKPQLALLVAPCLLVAGHRRIFVSWLLTTVLLVVASMLSLGASGLHQYAQVLGSLHSAEFSRHFTLAALGAGSTLTIALEGLAAVVTLVVAYRIRDQGTASVIAVALLGGMLAAPYLHVEDFTVLLPAAWFLLREADSIAQRLWLLPIAVTMELAWVLGPLPILASLTISLLLFLFPRSEPRSIALAA